MLASLLERSGGHIDLLKVDIEGFEYALFKEVPHELFTDIKRVAIEYHGCEGYLELEPQFHAAGFSTSRLVKSGNRGIVEFSRNSE